MSRTRTGAALALLALALLAVPGGSSADTSSPTWAGTWNSDFGEMTLDAGGSGNYVSPFGAGSSGTISGKVDGRVNKGTWKQPNSSGTFIFTMSGSGLTFTGDWAYDQGGCGSSCGWNGECIKGPCKENDDPAPAEPPLCGAASFLAADPPREPCHLGSLPFGSEVGVPAPSRGATVDISPKPMRANAVEVLTAIRELLAEEEEAEIIASVAVAFEFGVRTSEDFKGCVMFGEAVVLGGTPSVGSEQRSALLRACLRLVKDEATRIVQGSTAAAGCKALFVPVFPKGQKVTKRKRKRAVAAARQRLATSCKQRRVGRLSLSVRARGKDATLAHVTGRRLGVRVARRVPRGAPQQRLGVRWRARKN